MPSAIDEGTRRRLKAPARSGESLLEPPPADWDRLWHDNRQLRASYSGPLSAWAQVARGELHAAALSYTRQYRDVDDPLRSADRLILSGHQPNLFHPGVWFKNFVLSQLGRRFTACAIQLNIDNDLYRQAAIQVPTGSLAQPRLEMVRFDQVARVVPFELATVSDESLFVGFGEHVAQLIRPFVANPLVERFWPIAVRELRRTGNVGQAIAAARHVLEGEHGLATLEVPLSSVCNSGTFRRFVAHLLARGDSFAEIHNRCLTEFREQHKLRSTNHPVPDLSRVDSETETPFWVWSAESPIRRRLFVRRTSRDLCLSDHHQFQANFANEDSLADGLNQLEGDGIFIRPRALITTMYARTVLSDLFVHGIGGAIYDAVTDEIVRRFFDVPPPQFITATATVHLPIPCPTVSERDLIRVDGELRDFKYHPEKHFDRRTEVASELAEEKRAWIERDSSSTNLKERHDAIADLNRRMYALIQEQVSDVRNQREQMLIDIRRAKILASREHSFVLFPNSLIEQLKSLTPA